MFEVNSYGGALGTVFLNYDYTSYKPDYVPAKWVLDAYANADLRYNAYFGSVTTGFSHALTWPLLIKYMGNQDFISQRVLCASIGIYLKHYFPDDFSRIIILPHIRKIIVSNRITVLCSIS